MGIFDDLRANLGELVDAVVGNARETAQTTSEQAKEVREDLRDLVREGIDAAGPHLRRGLGFAAFAAGWVAREGRRMSELLADLPRRAAEADEDAEAEPWRAAEPEEPEYEERPMSEAEEVWARQVFRDTLPYSSIHLSNRLGLHGRPYTVPHPLHLDAFVLHLGPDAYADPTSPTLRVDGHRADVVFIRELTHVWQGVHHWQPLDYALATLAGQFVRGDDAYRYAPGKEWDEYGVEQQAALVRDWYLSGMPAGGALFPYVRDHLWAAEL